LKTVINQKMFHNGCAECDCRLPFAVIVHGRELSICIQLVASRFIVPPQRDQLLPIPYASARKSMELRFVAFAGRQSSSSGEFRVHDLCRRFGMRLAYCLFLRCALGFAFSSLMYGLGLDGCLL
jgi:hypothetical protein